MSSHKILKDAINAGLATLPVKVKQEKWTLNISGNSIVCTVVCSASHRKRVKHKAAADYEGPVDRYKVDDATRAAGHLLAKMIRDWILGGGNLGKAAMK